MDAVPNVAVNGIKKVIIYLKFFKRFLEIYFIDLNVISDSQQKMRCFYSVSLGTSGGKNREHVSLRVSITRWSEIKAYAL